MINTQQTLEKIMSKTPQQEDVRASASYLRYKSAVSDKVMLVKFLGDNKIPCTIYEGANGDLQVEQDFPGFSLFLMKTILNKNYAYAGYSDYRASFSTLKDLLDDMKKSLEYSRKRLIKLGLSENLTMMHFLLINSDIRIQDPLMRTTKNKSLSGIMGPHDIEKILPYADTLEKFSVFMEYEIPEEFYSETTFSSPREWLDTLFVKRVEKEREELGFFS